MPCQRVGCSEILVWLLWAPEDRSRRPSSISEITNTSPLIPSLDIAPMPQVYNALADTDKVILPSNRGIEGLARICPRRSVRVMQNCNIACLTPDYGDIPTAAANPVRWGYSIVVAVGDRTIAGQATGGQRVYFYNGNGEITSMPINRFVNLPTRPTRW